MGRFGLSQAVTRREDLRLLTGRGQFIDDQTLPGLVYSFVLRSTHAHAHIDAMDLAAARRAPGVLAVYTAGDLNADGIKAIACLNVPKLAAGEAFNARPQPALAGDQVRFVGEGLAFVVAESAQQAQDAAELIDVDYSPLPVVTACDAEPGDLCFNWELGDRTATDTAFATAARVITLKEINNRVVVNPIETRGAIGHCDPGSGKLTLRTNTQMPNPMCKQLAERIFQLPRQQVRVLVEDVGGGFGGRNSLYPEHILVLYAARKLGRPVKWIGSRSEGFLSDFHGRDNITRGELALDEEGHFLALRVATHANLGAYTASRGAVSPINVQMASNTYRIPALHVQVRTVHTNTAPTDPYRGAGRPEIIYLVERLVDVAARDTGIDRIELRRRNFIPPDAFPYATPTGLTYEYCDFPALLDKGLTHTRWREFDQRRVESAGRGRLRGIGMNFYVERCGGGGGLSESARLCFSSDGVVTLYIGTMSNGQGHETAYSQIISERLGLDFEQIRVVQGDTDAIPTGGGTGGSWSIPMGGGAICLAAERIIEKARRIAGQRLEAAVADIVFNDGVFSVAGTDLSLSLGEIAQLAFEPNALPEGEPPGLDEQARYQPANHTFPYGCHVCEVEVDPETGAVELLSYSALHDFGRALNPLLLAGQVHGGVAQGIGQALLEHTIYDDEGQLISGSLLDYCLPRADHLPRFDFVPIESPSPHNPMDVKGCGEAGAAGPPPALINAIVDALSPYGVRHVDMPATPERIWKTLQQAKSGDHP